MADQDVVEEKKLDEPNLLEKKIIRQLEFYFGDRNLSKDNYLQEKIKENDLGVDFSVLLTFNRLKALSTDCSVIANALRKSSSDLLEVSDDDLKVRRKSFQVLPTLALISPEARKEMTKRTLYMKGFPEDTTLDDIEEFLLSFGDTELIKMKKFIGGEKDKQFKGSLFVEFKSRDSVNRILEMPDIKYNDNTITIETKENYFIRKNSKKRPENSDMKSQISTTKKDLKDNVVKQMGAILHFKGCGKDTTREALKEYFCQYASVAWIDFQKGDSEGYIRFEEENGGRKAFQEITKEENPQLCGNETVLNVLEGAEEIKYWEKLNQRKSKFNKSAKHGRRKKRSHTFTESSDEPTLKAVKEF